MTYIRISNVKTNGLIPMDFYNNPNYKLFGVNSGSSTLVPFYRELLRNVLDNKVDLTFDDFELNALIIGEIAAVFEHEIDNTIPLIEPLDKRRYKYWTLEWKGKSYELNLSLISPNSRKIEDFYQIIQICKECLAENKPMYLSIE